MALPGGRSLTGDGASPADGCRIWDRLTRYCLRFVFASSAAQVVRDKGTQAIRQGLTEWIAFARVVGAASRAPHALSA